MSIGGKMDETTLFNQAGATATARHLQSITTVFRAVEFLLFVTVISQAPLVFPLNFLRHLAVTVISPPFVFVVGNAIVVTLLLKSGSDKLSHSNKTPDPKPDTTFIVTVYSSSSSSGGKTACGGGESTPAEEVRINCYRRKSDVMRRKNTEAVERRVMCTCEGHSPEDHMSRKEFRRKIEDFISRQQRFLIEEESFIDH